MVLVNKIKRGLTQILLRKIPINQRRELLVFSDGMLTTMFQIRITSMGWIPLWMRIRIRLFTLVDPAPAIHLKKLGSMYTRGLQFYTFFGISIGITRRIIDMGKKIIFTFCKMFENVQFFRICILRLQKVLL